MQRSWISWCPNWLSLAVALYKFKVYNYDLPPRISTVIWLRKFNAVYLAASANLPGKALSNLALKRQIVLSACMEWCLVGWRRSDSLFRKRNWRWEIEASSVYFASVFLPSVCLPPFHLSPLSHTIVRPSHLDFPSLWLSSIREASSAN